MSDHLKIVESVTFGLWMAFAAGPAMKVMDAVNNRWLGRLRRRMEELGVRMPFFTVAMRWWWVVVVVAWMFMAFVMDMKPIAAVVTLFLISFPGTLLAHFAEKRRIQIRDQMVIACRLLSSQLNAGPNITAGLREVTPGLPLPLREEFQRMTDEHYRHGLTIAEVLTGFRVGMKIDAVSLFSNVLLACFQNGGDASLAVRKISESLEQLQRVELKKSTYTASGRLQVGILSVFPLLFMWLMNLMDPRSVQLMLHSYYGQLVLSAVLILTYAAVRWTLRILDAID